MMSVPIEEQFFHYDKNGVSVLLPKNLRVAHDAPELYAVATKGYGDFLLELNPEKEAQKAWEEMLRRPQGTNPQLLTTVLRERKLSQPYRGQERIIEHRVVGRPDMPADFGWILLLYPKGSFLHVQIGADGTFAENEPIWQPVIDSIRVTDCDATGASQASIPGESEKWPPSATWLRAQVRDVPAQFSWVFLAFDPRDVERGAMRYSAMEFAGQLLPFEADWFCSVEEAKDLCQKELGIAPQEWQELPEEPAFHDGPYWRRECDSH